MWSPRLTFHGYPAPRTGQASLTAAVFQGGGLLLLGKTRKGVRERANPTRNSEPEGLRKTELTPNWVLIKRQITLYLRQNPLRGILFNGDK